MQPDPEKGFYRKRRFDWSGMVVTARSPKHIFIGRGKPGDKEIAPTLGLSSEFIDPLLIGGETIVASPSLIRVGVGRFDVKVDEKGKPQLQMTAPFPWKVVEREASIFYEQEVRDPSGYAYRYTKELELAPGKPIIRVTCSLKNTGKLPIKTRNYHHNWFRLDDVALGPEISLELPYDLPPLLVDAKFPNGAWIEGPYVAFHPVEKRTGGAVWVELKAVEDAKKNAFILRNHGTGAEIRHRGDWTPVQHKVYATTREFCPEPFLHLDLAPGREKSWSMTYEFVDSSPSQPPKPQAPAQPASSGVPSAPAG